MFGSESALVGALARNLRDTAGVLGLEDCRSVTLMAEVQVGGRIPDLLIVDTPDGALDSGPLTIFESSVVSALRSTCQTGPQLSDSLFSREARTRDALEGLEARGIVERLRSGRYRCQGTFPKGITIAAIEAKLTRWRDAVRQAESYADFADESYVALPQSLVVEKPALLSLFSSLGLGLFSVAPESVTIEVRPQPKKPDSADWVWLLSRLSSSRTNGRSCLSE